MSSDAGVDSSIDSGTSSDAGVDSSIDSGMSSDAGVDSSIDSGMGADANADAGDDDFGYSGGACKCRTRRKPMRPIDFFGIGIVLLGLTRRRRRTKPKETAATRATLFVALGLVLAPLSTQAQPPDPGIRLNRFRLAPLAADTFGVSRPTVHAEGIGVRFVADYAHDPLVVEAVPGESNSEIGAVVEHQLTSSVVGSYAFVDRFALFAGLSVNPVMSGETFDGAVEADGTSMGDLWLGGRARIYGEDGDVFRFGAEVLVVLPTADWFDDDQRLAGVSALNAGGSLLAELSTGAMRFNAALGAMYLGETVGPGVERNLAIDYGVAAVYEATADLRLIAELRGSLSTEGDNEADDDAHEWTLGGQYRVAKEVMLTAGGGAGVTRGVGSPDLRLILGVGYAPGAPESPVAPGDRDRDGILDPDDKCPDDPEDRDGFEDADGCPDPDNDADGIADEPDSCPDDPEDNDGFEDEDGCPDPDNDGDRVADEIDECPLVPGRLEDGCPETLRVSIEDSRIVVLEHVEFEFDKATLLERSKEILDEVAQLMKDNAQVRRVRIEGHTDLKGRERYNLRLSVRRAQTVAQYLISRGIPKNALEAFGCGELRPIEPDNEQSQKNRRVEFLIVDPPSQIMNLSTEGCEEVPLVDLPKTSE